MISKETIKSIKTWLRDFKSTQPGNVQLDEDTFEGSAYYLFQCVLSENKGRD